MDLHTQCVILYNFLIHVILNLTSLVWEYPWHFIWSSQTSNQVYHILMFIFKVGPL